MSGATCPVLPDNLRFSKDRSAIIRLDDLRFHCCVNALSATMNTRHAALELGISEKSLIDFCGEHNITVELRRKMRAHFATLNKVRIIYKYDHGESHKTNFYEKEICRKNTS